MGFNLQEVLTLVIACGGFVGTVALLILNLKVQGAMAELRLDVANGRTEAARDRAELYEKIMDTMRSTFVSREASDERHQANIKRLDSIDENLRTLSQRVTDIG